MSRPARGRERWLYRPGKCPDKESVRLSDFKSNEYAGLLGGKSFEPPEANPMLGFRDANRYAHPQYRDSFALECRAMRRVREEMWLTGSERRQV
jgi:pyruvate,water dikinase